MQACINSKAYAELFKLSNLYTVSLVVHQKVNKYTKNKLKLFYISMTGFQYGAWTHIKLVKLLIIAIINIISRHEIHDSKVFFPLIHRIQECPSCKDNNWDHRHIDIWMS